MINWRISTCAMTVLALAACAPSGDKDREQNAPIGYELALARDAGTDIVAPTASAVSDLTVEELQAKIDNGSIRLIDVRTDEEVAEGTIPGAEHIALDEFDPAQLDFSDGREVVLYCRSGRRSGIAGERLANHTGEPAQHLAGGIIAWQAADNPITTD